MEELEAKLKGLGDRFCKVTLPAILQLAKQQGESVDLDKAPMLGMINSAVHLHEIIITESTFIFTEKIVVMLKFILKSLRCSKKEQVSETVKSILFVSEVNINL